MLKEVCHVTDVDLDQPSEVGLKDIMRMEWQANYFASWLLMPTDNLRKAFFDEATRRRLVDRGHGLLYMDNQQCNVDTYYAVTMSIMNKFSVSRSVVRIRLKELGLLNESMKPVNKPSFKW
jgi:Zn-dependent peptidase ImmA (M78 family)